VAFKSLLVCVVFLIAETFRGSALNAADAAAVNAAAASIRAEEMQQQVNVLASDTFEGREAGSRGGRAAGAYIIEKLRKLKVAPAGEQGSYEQIFGSGYRNILAVLPGSDEKLKNEYVLVGAHYDHVGYGNQENSLGPVGYIHNGADDNASGTAGLLSFVRAFASMPQAPRRSILFALWDGEEKGLLGSEHWVSAPTVPLSQVKFAVNMDMIGRLRDQRVEVYGVRTAPGLRRMLAEANRQNSLYFEFNWDNLRDSDHYPLYLRRIPYIMPFTFKHDDYHRPSDDVDKINREGMEQIARVFFRVINTVADAPFAPKFRGEATQETQYNQRQSSRPAPAEPSRLGVVWEAEAEKNDVIRLASVDTGSPADAGGLKVGDRILEFGGYQVGGKQNFRGIVIAAANPVNVVVERKGREKPLTLSLTLNGTPRKIGFTWRLDNAEPNVVIMSRVDPGSPAAQAGLQINDRVHSVDGRDFASESAFRELIASGEPFDITFERRGHVRHARIVPLRPAGSAPVVAQKPVAAGSNATLGTP
jgi:membrane-associated protease RseP (regulator of RpoE activity)